jgi:predicted phosphate transport protein (TIGR00153 family)
MAAAKKNFDYFDMFVQGVGYALNAARLLKELLDGDQLSEMKISEIKKIEQEADNHMHLICDNLNVAFITPIDRDDIYRIASETDDITDSIDSVATKLWMMRVSNVTPALRLMAEYVVNACDKLVLLMSEIKNHKKHNKLNEITVEINRIEEMGDRCYKDAMRELFGTEKDPIELIKMKEIYKDIEDALDNCEDVADCVQSIIITKT